DAGRTDAGMTARRHRRRPELALHHARKARQRRIAAGRAGAEQIDAPGRDARALETRTDRLRSHSSGAEARDAFRIRRVVASPNAVLREDPPLDPLRRAVQRRDISVDFVVRDRLARIE